MVVAVIEAFELGSCNWTIVEEVTGGTDFFRLRMWVGSLRHAQIVATDSGLSRNEMLRVVGGR